MKKLVGSCWMLLSSFATLCLVAVISEDHGPLIYQLVEEEPAGTFIANLRRDSNLSLIYSAESAFVATFNLMSASAHFHVDPDTGILSTSEVIDRDVLCPGQSVCQLSADVVVRPMRYFRKVTVEIVDLNDNSPAFPHRHTTVYVSEATLPGQLLFPVQSAYDVDSPRHGVVGYKLIEESSTSADTFQLTVDNAAAAGFDVRVVLLRPLDRERRSFYPVSYTHLTLPTILRV